MVAVKWTISREESITGVSTRDPEPTFPENASVLIVMMGHSMSSAHRSSVARPDVPTFVLYSSGDGCES